MKKLIILAATLLTTAGLSAQQPLEKLWQDPPKDARPWNFWYWMYGAFTREGITADLQAGLWSHTGQTSPCSPAAYLAT